MKLILSLALLSFLASCTSMRIDKTRPTAELPCRGVKNTNQGLGYLSRGVGQGGTSVMDVTDDTTDYGGQVLDGQGRDYTNIVMNTARRGDDVVYRESGRYTNHAMDTVDDGASFGARAIRRYPNVAADVVQRGFGSTRKVYQSGVGAYGDVVDKSYWSFWNIFSPPEPKNYMVGSLNDMYGAHALPGSGWRCRLPEIPAPEAPLTSGKNPVTVYK